MIPNTILRFRPSFGQTDVVITGLVYIPMYHGSCIFIAQRKIKFEKNGWYHFDIHNFETIITGIRSSSLFLCTNFVHLLDRVDLFKFINLVCDGKENIWSLYSSLKLQDTVGIVRKQVPFLREKIDALRNISE